MQDQWMQQVRRLAEFQTVRGVESKLPPPGSEPMHGTTEMIGGSGNAPCFLVEREQTSLSSPSVRVCLSIYILSLHST
jgi:hypothetical protein